MPQGSGSTDFRLQRLEREVLPRIGQVDNSFSPEEVVLADSVVGPSGFLAILTWLDSPNPNVTSYEVWIEYQEVEETSKVLTVEGSPASFTLNVETQQAVRAIVRPWSSILEEGLPLEECPSTAFVVDPPILDGADLETGSVGDSKLDRTSGDKIVIIDGDVQSVSATKITGQITAGQIQSIQADQITGAILSDQIQSLAVAKLDGQITASQIDSVNSTDIVGQIISTQIGSINATTITVNQIQDSQIAGIGAGKITAGSITAAISINLVTGNQSIFMDANGYVQTDTGVTQTVEIKEGTVVCKRTTGTYPDTLTLGSNLLDIRAVNNGGTGLRDVIRIREDTDGGELTIWNRNENIILNMVNSGSPTQREGVISNTDGSGTTRYYAPCLNGSRKAFQWGYIQFPSLGTTQSVSTNLGSLDNVQITPDSDNSSDGPYWVTSVSGTSFTINRTATGSLRGVFWVAFGDQA